MYITTTEQMSLSHSFINFNNLKFVVPSILPFHYESQSQNKIIIHCFDYMMKVVTFMLSSISLLIQQYANNFEQEDLKLTLTQLRDDLGLPRIQTYDYIVGKNKNLPNSK